MPTPEQSLLTRLRDTEGALLRQLESIDRIAEGAGVPPHQLMTPDGAFMAAPVLVALANVRIALLGQGAQECGAADAPWDGTEQFPCVRHSGHAGRHADRDDDEWKSDA